jgi:hypothetical protein
MGLASGIAGQMGFKAEATFGTRVVVDRFIELRSDTLKFHPNRIPSKGIRAGRTTGHRWHNTTSFVDGSTFHELGPQNTALIWKHLLGAVTTTGSNPYTHAVTKTSGWDALSMTVQVVKPDITGTARIHEYTGMQVIGANLTQSADDLLILELQWYGVNETTNQTIASASYPASYIPFSMDQCALTLGGSATPFKSLSVAFPSMAATGLFRSGAKTPIQARIAGRAEPGGTLTLDYTGLTDYARFTGGADTAFSAIWTNGTTSLTIAGNTRFDGDTPGLPGDDLLEMPMPFIFYSPTSDALALTVTTVNTDVTA